MADSTTTTTPGNADWLQPYWQSWLTRMQGLTNNPMPVYGGPTVAPFSQNQTTAFDMSRQLAMNGTPAYNASTGAIANIAGGQQNPYMGTNPYTQQVINGLNSNMADAYARGTAAQTASSAAMNGAYGGSAYQEQQAANNKAFADSVANADANLLNQNYYANANMWQQGVGNQLNAAGLGIASQGADLNAIGNLYNMGANQQGNTQALLNAGQDYWNKTQQSPFVSAGLFGNARSQAGGAPPSTTSTVNGPGQSPWSYLSLLPIAASLFGG